MKRKEAPPPWAHTDAPAIVTHGIRAMHYGTASDVQQQAVLQWMIEVLCATYDASYRPDSERDTVFAEGKRYVGNQILRQLKVVNIGKTAAKSGA